MTFHERDQLKAMLDAQRLRLQQLNRLSITSREAYALSMQVQELCDSLESAVGCAEFLDTQRELESRLYTQEKAGETQPESEKNPAGFTLAPHPEEQGRLALEPSRPIPPAPQYQGSMRDRYDIYVSCVEGTGQPVKTFDEWMNS